MEKWVRPTSVGTLKVVTLFSPSRLYFGASFVHKVHKVVSPPLLWGCIYSRSKLDVKTTVAVYTRNAYSTWFIAYVFEGQESQVSSGYIAGFLSACCLRLAVVHSRSRVCHRHPQREACRGQFSILPSSTVARPLRFRLAKVSELRFTMFLRGMLLFASRRP